MSGGNWPSDGAMIPAPVVTCVNNEITIKWQTCFLHPATTAGVVNTAFVQSGRVNELKAMKSEDIK